MIRRLREADRLLGEGKTIPEVARALEVSANTYHRWQRQSGGMKADDAKRLCLAPEVLLAGTGRPFAEEFFAAAASERWSVTQMAPLVRRLHF